MVTPSSKDNSRGRKKTVSYFFTIYLLFLSSRKVVLLRGEQAYKSWITTFHLSFPAIPTKMIHHKYPFQSYFEVRSVSSSEGPDFGLKCGILARMLLVLVQTWSRLLAGPHHFLDLRASAPGVVKRPLKFHWGPGQKNRPHRGGGSQRLCPAQNLSGTTNKASKVGGCLRGAGHCPARASDTYGMSISHTKTSRQSFMLPSLHPLFPARRLTLPLPPST